MTVTRNTIETDDGRNSRAKDAIIRTLGTEVVAGRTGRMLIGPAGRIGVGDEIHMDGTTIDETDTDHRVTGQTCHHQSNG